MLSRKSNISSNHTINHGKFRIDRRSNSFELPKPSTNNYQHSTISLKHSTTNFQLSILKSLVFSFLFLLVFTFSFSVFSLGTASAAPNYQMNYQGKLTNASNVAVPNGSYNIRFRLCTDSSCAAVIYTETHCYSPDSGSTCDGTGTDQRVVLTNGLFSTMIGSVLSTLSSVNFSQTLYLGVTIGGSDTTPTWDPEMSPRKTLGTVPSAFESLNSDKLDSRHESEFALLLGRAGGQSLIGGTAADETLTLQGTSSAGNTLTNAGIQLKVGDAGITTAITILNNGNVGIGVVSPNNTLQVAGLIDFNDTDFNTKLGSQAGKNIVVGAQYNTFVGYQSGLSSASSSTNAADKNSGFGYQSLYSNTSGKENTAIGYESLYSNTGGNYNVAIGSQSLYNHTDNDGNTAIGYRSLYNNTANSNTAIGYSALFSTTTQSENTAVGYSALLNSTDYGNTASGYWSLSSNKGGDYNTAYGRLSGNKITTGSYNTFLGDEVGYDDLQLVSAVNSMALGYGTYTTASNQAVYGNNSMTEHIFQAGKVGIGDTSPDTILDILSSQASNTELTITNTNAGAYSPQIGLSVVEGTNSFTIGVDDNDNQKFKVSTTALGTSDILTIDSRTTTSGISTVTLQGSSATIASAAGAELTTLTITPPTVTLTGSTQVTSQMDSILINAPTITDASAVTVDSAATLTISGAPIKGGSVTLSNTYALKINSQAVSTATASYGLFVDAQTGATNNYAAVFNTGNVGIGTSTPGALLDVNGNVLVSGDNRYINFDTTSGSDGYGFRDNAGTMEYKDSGGSWTGFGGTLSWTSQEFSTPGTATWTKPASVSYVWVLCVGGGGGGGASADTSGAGGGGAGEVRQDFVTVSGDVTVTIGSAGTAGAALSGNGGNGGNSSFGALVVAAGGKYGYGSSYGTAGGGGMGGGASGPAGAGGLSGGVLGGIGSNSVTASLGVNNNPGIVNAGASGGGGARGITTPSAGGSGGTSGLYLGGAGGAAGGYGGGGGGGGGYGGAGGGGGSGASNSAQAGQGYGAGGGGAGGYGGGSGYNGAAGYKGYCKVWWQE